MSQLVAYYEEQPRGLKNKVEVDQIALATASGERTAEGLVRAGLVYVRFSSEAGPFLVPFGDYDEWSLRDRYNEAIRIMNTLGASGIVCETFREVLVKRKLGARIMGKGASVTQQRVLNSGFDFRHSGAGSTPRDPRPLRWPDEPGFAAAVSSVLENGATHVDLNIRTNRTHAIDGELGITLKRVGFDLGGSSQQSGATSLHIRADFPQRKGWWSGS